MTKLKFKCALIMGSIMLLDLAGHSFIAYHEHIRKTKEKMEQCREVQPLIHYAGAIIGGYVFPQEKDEYLTIYDQSLFTESYYAAQKDKNNQENKELIPSYYKNELIAYPSETGTLDKIVIERFKDIGYSLGIYNATFNSETGYIEFSVSQNVPIASSAYKVLSEGKSDSIQLVSIDDQPVTEEMINSNGIFTGLEANRSYKIGYYAGTYYTTADITADEYFIQSYERYFVDAAELTRHGYLSIVMPDDAKSGYYMVNEAGLFKYYNYEKGDRNNAQEDMNEPYYANREEQLSAYSQQYVVSISEKTKYVAFECTYNKGTYEDIDISGVLTAPDGKEYILINDTENNKLTIMLTEAMAGRWTINIAPKDLVVTDISAKSTLNPNEAVKDIYEFAISDPDENILFYATYRGNGVIWGIIENENGEAVDMDIDEKNKMLSYTYPYLPSGTYKMTVYHYSDVAVDKTNYEKDASRQEEEIITVEE